MAAAGPRLPFAWQAQYTEPPHFPFAWQAQYTELPGGAAARWPPLARGCLLPGNTQTTVYHSATFSHIDSSVNFIFLLPHQLCQVPYTAQNDDA